MFQLKLSMETFPVKLIDEVISRILAGQKTSPEFHFGSVGDSALWCEHQCRCLGISSSLFPLPQQHSGVMRRTLPSWEGYAIHKTLGSFYLFNYWTCSLSPERPAHPGGMQGADSSLAGDNKRKPAYSKWEREDSKSSVGGEFSTDAYRLCTRVWFF